MAAIRGCLLGQSSELQTGELLTCLFVYVHAALCLHVILLALVWLRWSHALAVLCTLLMCWKLICTRKGKLHIARIEAIVAGRGHAKMFVLCIFVLSSLAMPNQCQGMCGYNLCSLHAAHVTT